MNWVALALISAATYGAIAVVDKRLLDKHIPSLSGYFVWVAVSVATYGVVLLFLGGVPESALSANTLSAVASGLCWGGAMAFMFWGFKIQEVSRASAILFTFPIFVALFASLFLGESLAIGQWGAIVVVVLGALIASLKVSPKAIRPMKANRYWEGKAKAVRYPRFSLALPILLCSSVLTAAAHITGKYALQELSVWQVTAIGFLGTAVVLGYVASPQSVRQVFDAMKKREALGLMLLSEGLLVPIAVVSMIAATKLGPVSLVATIAGTRPIFVLLYSAVLSLSGVRFLDESLNKQALAVKVVSVAMIIVGIVSL